MAETIIEGASLAQENDEDCQGSGQDIVELQSLGNNQETSCEGGENESENHEDDSGLNFSPAFYLTLLVEMVLSFADLVSDTWTGYSLLEKLESKVWGSISFGINWIPGAVGAIHIIFNHRSFGMIRTVVYCLASLVLCPLVPSLTYLYLLCKVPQNSRERRNINTREFQQILSFARIVRALEGCIESPLQLLYKTFLMFNGVIAFNFTNPDLTIKGLQGNTVKVPFFINFLISGLTLIKSVYGLNMPFFKIKTTSKYPAILSWLDFVGFLVTTTLFKLGALILLWGYSNWYTSVPMIAIILLGIYVNLSTIYEHENIPNWLLVFMNLFVPICFTTKDDEDISKVQAKNLKLQTWNCSTFYGLSLIALGLLVAFSRLNMSPNIPINFEMFLLFIITTFLMGILSTFFSFCLELSESMTTSKKIVLIMAKTLRLIVLLGLIVTSSILLSTTPKPSSTYLVIWSSNSQPIVFETMAIIPLKTPVMNVTSKDIAINEYQDFNKVAVVQDDEGFKPSSPLPYPTLIIKEEDRSQFGNVFHENKNYNLISKEHTAAGCQDYKFLTNPNRKTSYATPVGGKQNKCDDSTNSKVSPDWQGPGWYRISPSIGTKIPTSPIAISHCGTGAPGSVNSNTLPALGQTINQTVCFNWSGDHCYWNETIKIKNCVEYLLYDLPTAPHCDLGYCVA